MIASDLQDDLPPPLPKQRVCDASGRVLFECRTLNYQRCLEEAVSAGADLTGAAFNVDGGLSCRHYAGLSLAKAKLARSRWTGCEMGGTAFADADLQGASFPSCNLSGANFTGARMEGASFGRANLSDVNFDAADLTGIRLQEATLDGATFRGAKLKGAALSEANLAGIRESLESLIVGAQSGVQALLNAIRDGKINGSVASKSITATVRDATPDHWRVQAQHGHLIERFATAIELGDTPKTNPASAIIEQWLADWILRDRSGFFGTRCPTCGAPRPDKAAA